MKIGTILFTYHRNRHTREVLKALSQNDLLPSKLYIFQDGIKNSTNYEEWKKVNEIILNIKWCETEIHVSKSNKGLKRSIVDGLNYVFNECDAVIVLEDDCVPNKQFMGFMVSALHTYEEAKKIFSISGYSWDVNLLSGGEDAYFNGRISSYGWGTWKDRWNQYEEDYDILKRIKNDPKASSRLKIWGQDLEGMIAENVMDRCDSWAVFWALKIIEKGGYCLSPYKQLVHNIGFDGTGVHCSKLQEKQSICEEKILKEFFFPSKIESSKDCEEEFQFLFSGKHGQEKSKLYQDILIQWIKMKQEEQEIRIPDEWNSVIAVWGKGKIFDCLYHELEGKVSIKYIIESRPSVEKYKDISVISISELPEDIRNIIVIPYFDLDIIKTKVGKIRKDVHLWGIDELLQW